MGVFLHFHPDIAEKLSDETLLIKEQDKQLRRKDSRLRVLKRDYGLSKKLERT